MQARQELIVYKCSRKACGHTWKPHRIGRVPLICPHCKSIYWRADWYKKLHSGQYSRTYLSRNLQAEVKRLRQQEQAA